MGVVQEFTTWCGMEINVLNIFLLAIDEDQKLKESLLALDVRINGERLKTLARDINDTCLYLDCWGTGNSDMSATGEVVRGKS